MYSFQNLLLFLILKKFLFHFFKNPFKFLGTYAKELQNCKDESILVSQFSICFYSDVFQEKDL
jgi:hypothetical protein